MSEENSDYNYVKNYNKASIRKFIRFDDIREYNIYQRRC